MKTLLCNCNRTMPLDAAALARTLRQVPGASAEGLETTHTLLCRREAGAFQRAARATAAAGEELLVACTQEQRLFLELNAQTEGAAGVAERPIRFVNLRETGGWSRDAHTATPKFAALIAAAQLPAPDPVATVSYASGGHCLVIGEAEAAERAARLLEDGDGGLEVSVLVTQGHGALAQRHERATQHGRLLRLAGWLGSFEVEWESANPIDLDLCTRCNACLVACPEGAIGLDYQIDLTVCRAHRACVRACDAAGAIDFERAPLRHEGRFDLVLDLRDEAAFTMHQPPQGYAHPGHDERALAAAVLRLRGLRGAFDKPRFLRYQGRLCAHSRNERIGCSACIEVCSARALRSDATRKGRTRSEAAGGVIVEPHLCVGCGACTTVCPSGAMAYAYPGTADQGRRLRVQLDAYARAGGRDAALLVHSEGAGQRLLDELGRAARVDAGVHGVPARVLPLAVWHTASVGLDLWLAAIAQGASQVWVLATDEEAPEYRDALREQMAVAQAILAGLGYAGRHLRLLEARDARDLAALDQALRAPAAQGVAKAAAFAVQADKRATLELALEHLLAQTAARAHAAPLPDALALPAAGAPFGAVQVAQDKCTLCMSCVGACPAAALLDNAERPQLRFVEKNCVQCGLCAATCPEDAITLVPRLLLAGAGRARRDQRVLAEMEPWRCVRCGKPFGTLRGVQTMIARLAGHAAFAGARAERLKMCGDCRVVDLHSGSDEVRITDL